MKNYGGKTFGHVCAAVSCALFASAVRLFAAEYPAPVDGTVTLTEAGTYSGSFPEGISTLSVAAGGTVTIDADNGSFTGTTVVQAGTTLIAANQYALGGESATVPGVDSVLVGPYDLSASMGKPGAWTDPEVARTFDFVCRKARDKGVLPGVFTECLYDVWKRRGVQYITVKTDTNALMAGFETARETCREACRDA